MKTSFSILSIVPRACNLGSGKETAFSGASSSLRKLFDDFWAENRGGER